jgi:hypothetical protein
MSDLLRQHFDDLEEIVLLPAWRVVQRRARRRRTRLSLLALVVTALVATAAVAATGGWWFSKDDDAVTARTQIRFHGRTWTVGLTVADGRWFCATVVPAGTSTGACVVAPFLKLQIARGQQSRSPVKIALGPPVAALGFAADGGEIWFGPAATDIARINITDDVGHVFRTGTVPPPPGLGTAFRFWVLPLESSSARTIAAYDAAGALVTRQRAGPARRLRTR